VLTIFFDFVLFIGVPEGLHEKMFEVCELRTMINAIY